MMRKLFASLFCLLAAQTGCSQDFTWRAVEHMIEANYPDVPSITTDSLAERLSDDTTPRPVLLDARSPEEYAVSHLRNAERVAPSANVYPALDTLAADTPIVVYCSVGYRSADVAKTLREQGFTTVAYLEGSIFRWANDGRPVYRKGRQVEAVHPYDPSWGTLLADSLHAYQPAPTSQ